MKRRSLNPLNQQSEDTSTGSPSPGGPVFLAVGRIYRPHGIKGEMVMEVLTGFPERLHPGKDVFVGDAHETVKIRSLRGHNKALLISFHGIFSPEEASRFRNALVFITAADLPDLPEGEYYHHELIGMTVSDEAGKVLGELVNVLETGANDVYEIKTPQGNELLLPAIADVVQEVNPNQQTMVVRLPEWYEPNA